MNDYLMLLHEHPGSIAKASAEEMQRIIEEYAAWAQRLGESGRLVGGEKLTDEGGRWVSRASAPVEVGGAGAGDDDGELGGPAIRVEDGPYSEAREVIGGFFQIRAASYDEAVEIAGSCPHVRYGSKIEVRQIDGRATGDDS